MSVTINYAAAGGGGGGGGGGGITSLASAPDFATAALASGNTSISTGLAGKESLASINGSTLATGSIGSSLDNTTQTAASAATLTMTAGMSTPTGFVIDAPSGCTIAWGSTFGINGAANGAGSVAVPAGGYAVFRQKTGTDQYEIGIGPVTDAVTMRTDGASFTLANTDLGGASLCASAITVTVGTQASGFWRVFEGAGVVTFSGSGVTVTDKRVSGATNPACMLLFTSTTTADVIGSKA